MSERRSVPGRRWKITELCVDFLIAIKVSPNIASLIGMFFGIISGFFFFMTSKNPKIFWILGAISVFLRSAFNIFDGMIAEKTGKASSWGGFVNDFTDRLADVVMIVGFGYAIYSSKIIGFLAAIGALLTATVRTTGKAYGAKMNYKGIMSKPIRMYLIIFSSLIMTFYPVKNLPFYTLYLILIGTIITIIQRIWIIKQELS